MQTITVIDAPTVCKSTVELDDNGDVLIEIAHEGITACVGLKPESARKLAESILGVLAPQPA